MALSDNLISYWKLDGNSQDKVGSNNGTDTNITYGTSYGKLFQGALMNGTSSKILISSINPNEITISAWIKSTNFNSTYTIIGDGTTNGGTLQFRTDGNVLKFLKSYIGGGAYSTSNLLITNAWNHCILTYNQTSGVYSFYINGQSAGSGTLSSIITFNSYQLSIGSNHNTEYLNGSIDEVGVWSRALSATEIAQLYNGGIGKTYPFESTFGEYLPNSSTKLLLHLNGNSVDSSGNGNNGTDTAITYSQANGKFGQGAGFNGSTSKISVGGLGLSTGLTAITVSCWVYPTTLANGADYLSQKFMVNIGIDNFYLMQNFTQDWTFGFRANDTNFYEASSNIKYIANQWRHVLGTYDGTNLKLYIDGEFVRLRSYSGSTLGSNTTIGNIGTVDGTNRFLNGYLDEVIIENRAWSASEVKKYYTNSRGMFGII